MPYCPTTSTLPRQTAHFRRKLVFQNFTGFCYTHNYKSTSFCILRYSDAYMPFIRQKSTCANHTVPFDRLKSLAKSRTNSIIPSSSLVQTSPQSIPKTLLINPNTERLIINYIDRNQLIQAMDILWSHRSVGNMISLDTLDLICSAVLNHGCHHTISSYLRWATLYANSSNRQSMMPMLCRIVQESKSASHASIVLDFIYRNKISTSPQSLILFSIIFTENNQHSDAKNIIDELIRSSQFGKASSDVYEALIYHALLTQDFKVAFSILVWAIEFNICLGEKSISQFAHKLSKAGKMKSITILLQLCKDYRLGGVSGIAHIYSAAIRCHIYTQPRNLDGLMQILKCVTPDMLTKSSCLVATLVATAHHVERLDPHVYIPILSTSLLRSHFNRMDASIFYEIVDTLSTPPLSRQILPKLWLNEMITAGHRPPVDLLVQILTNAIDHRAFKSTEKMFNETYRQGYRVSKSLFTMIIQMQAEACNPQTTHWYIDRMLREGYSLTLPILHSLIRMFIQLNDLDEALSLLKRAPEIDQALHQAIKEHANEATVDCSLTELMCRKPNVVGLSKSFESRVQSKSNVNSMHDILTEVVEWYVRLDQLDEARRYIDLILKLDHRVQTIAFSIYIKGFGIANRRSELVSFIAHLPYMYTRPDERLFAALALALSRCQDFTIHDIERVISIMVTYYGITPTQDYMWTALMRCYQCASSFICIRHVWLAYMDNMYSSGRLINPTPSDCHQLNCMLTLLVTTWGTSDCNTIAAIGMHSDWIGDQFSQCIRNYNVILDVQSWTKLSTVSAIYQVPRLFLFVLDCAVNSDHDPNEFQLSTDIESADQSKQEPQEHQSKRDGTVLKWYTANTKQSRTTKSLKFKAIHVTPEILSSVYMTLVQGDDQFGITILGHLVNQILEHRTSVKMRELGERIRMH
ncbi:hypothetical protein QVD99_005319 [Batrachochytrium dendrobatidis]|nr:hypothetical protein O5D80_004346 [Batrachochytrium dendrobatidis]KAK5668286.1 hypothetical protein QVD99_005319 [Batrachochytrium dendrobatidis]